jgi:gluconate 2-dehydrogenase gamma chain
LAWFRNLSRREFIKTAAAAAVASGAAGCSANKSPWRFLKVGEARTLAAVCDCLIPPDSDPGAEWAEVVNYIDLQLCGPFRNLRDSYREGITALEQTSQAQYGKAFTALSTEQQESLLKELEAGLVPKELWTKAKPRDFFEMVLAHTMQGYYGDPRHGGNRERASWKMLGLTYPQIRGRARVAEQKSS